LLYGGSRVKRFMEKSQERRVSLRAAAGGKKKKHISISLAAGRPRRVRREGFEGAGDAPTPRPGASSSEIVFAAREIFSV